MKKDVILFSLFVLIFILPFAAAQTNTTMKANAKKCITDKVTDKNCSSFGLEDKIFSVLSVNKCKSELIGSVQGGECWGLGGCSIKTTSQAILALDEANTNTDDYVGWLSNQTKDATGINWFIQVESPEATTCQIYDSNNNLHTISIREDKKISTISGTTCLNIDSTGYWLEIKSSCYKEDFDVSCDKAFLTNKFFKKSASSVIYVLSDAQQASAGGTTNVEKIESFCFKSGSSCDYEGTLWATLVLNKLGYDVSSYFPYLITFEEDNENLLPESFLYILTNEGDILNELILKQKREKFWEEKRGMYYDSALALLAVPDDNQARQSSINWLATEQRADGCWDSGSVMHTGFLIYSLWGSVPGGDPGGSGNYTSEDDCEDSNYSCLSGIACEEAGGNELSDYIGCSGTQICCDKDVLLQSCADLGGVLCEDATEICNGQPDYTADDSTYSTTCCIGTCEPRTTPPPDSEDTCTLKGYACRDDCETGEILTYDFECEDSSEYCCMPETPSPVKWWIWALVALIVLVILAIIFRNKLKELSLRSKAKKKPGSPTGPGKPGMPPPSSPMQQRPMPPRRMYPSQQRQMPPRRFVAPAKNKGEMDDVLKKLKEMGNK